MKQLQRSSLNFKETEVFETKIFTRYIKLKGSNEANFIQQLNSELFFSGVSQAYWTVYPYWTGILFRSVPGIIRNGAFF